MIVQVKVKSVFGRELIYPANDTADLVTKLTGKTTLSIGNLQICRLMGMSVDIVNSDPSSALVEEIYKIDKV